MNQYEMKYFIRNYERLIFILTVCAHKNAISSMYSLYLLNIYSLILHTRSISSSKLPQKPSNLSRNRES